MALTVVASGTTVALTLGTPLTVTTQTPAAPTVYVIRVDMGNLAVGEQLSLLIYTIALAAGTERLEEVYDFNYAGAGATMMRTDPIPTDVSMRAALLQVNGTGRLVPWKLYSL